MSEQRELTEGERNLIGHVATIDALTDPGPTVDWMETGGKQAALFAALARAQAKFDPIPKNKTVSITSTRQYSYPTLDKIFEVLRPALAAEELAVTQMFRGDLLVTSLLHSGGGMIESAMPCPRGNMKPQDYGSDITYCRRYSLTAILGVAGDEDDDGKTAQDATGAPRTAAKGSGGTATTPKPQNASQGVGLITDKQMKLVGAVLRKLGDGGVLDEDGYRAKLNEMNVDSTRDLTGPQASVLIDWLKELEAAMDVEL